MSVVNTQKGGHQYFRTLPDIDAELEYLVQFVLKEAADISKKKTPGVCVVAHVSRSVQPVVQNGPMCGLVALTMASSLLGGESSKVVYDEAHPLHPDVLLRQARQRGMSKNGEIFDVGFLKELAQDQLDSCRSEVMSLNSLNVVETILNHKALLIPYDADKDHTPCLEQGHKAHWCVIVGMAVVLPADENYSDVFECCRLNTSLGGHFTVLEGKVESLLLSHKWAAVSSQVQQVYVFARHGKSTHLGLWKLKDLLESNSNLVELDPKRTRPGEYVIPDGGIEEGLCGKALLISKT